MLARVGSRIGKREAGLWCLLYVRLLVVVLYEVHLYTARAMIHPRVLL